LIIYDLKLSHHRTGSNWKFCCRFHCAKCS
jgi:hypothetical protein